MDVQSAAFEYTPKYCVGHRLPADCVQSVHQCASLNIKYRDGRDLIMNLWHNNNSDKNDHYITPYSCTHNTCSTLVYVFCAFYHWRPHFSSNCCIGLERFARVSPVIAVVASFPQQTENRTSQYIDYCYVTSLFRLFVTCFCSLMT